MRFPAGASAPARSAFALAVAVVLVATLAPRGGAPQPVSLCLVCGDRGAADALRNLVLFGPLGAAIALCGWRGLRPMLAPALLSLAVETAQAWIPGRDPSLGDVVFNTAGAAIAFALVQSPGWWLRPRPRTRTVLMVAALAGVLLVPWLTGVLLQPDLPPSTYWGQWTPHLGHLEWYRGRILRTTLGPLDLPDGRLPLQAETRALLLARAPLVVRGIAGPPVPALGSLFSIADEQSREILLLGPDRDALVFRLRSRASALRLEQPELRAEGALRGLMAGDSFLVAVRPDRSGYCLDVNGRSSCGLGFTLGRGWGLMASPPLPYRARVLLDDLWITVLLVPLGFWLSGRWLGSLAVVAGATGFVLIPAATGLVATPPGQLVAAVAGLALGISLRRRAGAPSRSI